MEPYGPAMVESNDEGSPEISWALLFVHQIRISESHT